MSSDWSTNKKTRKKYPRSSVQSLDGIPHRTGKPFRLNIQGDVEGGELVIKRPRWYREDQTPEWNRAFAEIVEKGNGARQEVFDYVIRNWDGDQDEFDHLFNAVVSEREKRRNE